MTCDPAKLVFLDETAARTDMIRLRGRAMGAARCLDHAPGGHWNTMTFIAGLRMHELTAPWCLNRAMNGEAFKEYLRTQLAPTLNTGDLVICDNLSAHKVDGVQQIIEARGATILYLPPYSPDLNPIEQVFAKLKNLLRRAAARTSECLWRTIGKLLNRFSPQECQNYFNNSGYDHD